MSALILYTSEDGQAQVQREATDKESSIVQTEGARVAFGHAASDHFRNTAKWIGLGES